MLTDIAVGILVVLVFGMVLTVLAHLWMATPYGATPHVIAHEMIALARLQGSEKVYDLGAGDGRLLLLAKKLHPRITAVGFELAPLIYLWGRARIALAGGNVVLRLRNALTQNLRDADVIFLYLTPRLMAALEGKFDLELRRGTRVVSHVFRFPGRKPLEEKKVPWGRGEKTILLYQW